MHRLEKWCSRWGTPFSPPSFNMWICCLDWHHCRIVGQESQREEGTADCAQVWFPWREVTHCVQPHLVARSATVYVPAENVQPAVYIGGEVAVFSSKSPTSYLDLSHKYRLSPESWSGCVCESSYQGVTRCTYWESPLTPYVWSAGVKRPFQRNWHVPHMVLQLLPWKYYCTT